MDSFSISVDLSSFFNDFRAKSLVFVNTGSMNTVRHVETHIKTLFGIDSETYVLSQNNFVPGGEDSRILQKLTSIRLAGLVAGSNKRDRGVEQENETAQNESFELIPKRKRRQEKVADTDETSQSDSVRSSKRKIKRGEDDINVDHPSISNGISAHCSSSLKHPSACGVGKAWKGIDYYLSNKDGSFIDSNSSNKDKHEMPNTSFYGFENVREGSETLKDSGNLSTKIDDESGKSTKRKRIRKRKKAVKDEPEVQNVVIPITSRPLRLPQANSRHVFFNEEEVEDSQTPDNMQEEETINADDPVESTMTEQPDDKTGESREEETHIGDTNGNINGEVHSASAQASDCVEYTAPVDPPSATRPIESSIPKPKHDNSRDRQGFGKLLSLIRSEDPPVFERKKAPKNDQPVASGNVPMTLPQTLKTLPEQNMKISFQILKMSASYCPELSNTIVAVVKEVDAATQNLSLRILSGGEECQPPKGKFDLHPEETEEETRIEDINLNWSELIEPRVSK